MCTSYVRKRRTRSLFLVFALLMFRCKKFMTPLDSFVNPIAVAVHRFPGRGSYSVGCSSRSSYFLGSPRRGSMIAQHFSNKNGKQSPVSPSGFKNSMSAEGFPIRLAAIRLSSDSVVC